MVAVRLVEIEILERAKQKDPRISPGVKNTELSGEPALKPARQITYAVRTGCRACWSSSSSGCSNGTGSRPWVRSEEPGPEPEPPQEPGPDEPSGPHCHRHSHRNQFCSSLCHSSHRQLRSHKHADPLPLDDEHPCHNHPGQPSTRSRLRTSSSKDSCGAGRQVRRPLLCELVRRSHSDRR